MDIKSLFQTRLNLIRIVGAIIGGGLILSLVIMSTSAAGGDTEGGDGNGYSSYVSGGPSQGSNLNIVSGENGAIVEWLRSYENEWTREYRNGTASQGTINLVEQRHYARKNPQTGEEEYGLFEYNEKGDHSLDFAFGMLIYSYDNRQYLL